MRRNYYTQIKAERMKSVNICAWHASLILGLTIIFYYLASSLNFLHSDNPKARNFEGKTLDFRDAIMGNCNFLGKAATWSKQCLRKTSAALEHLCGLIVSQLFQLRLINSSPHCWNRLLLSPVVTESLLTTGFSNEDATCLGLEHC